ncbi:hypothetical protein [Bacillus suaedaesalsae]|uniref:Uncharacterized protein n=1 Tax=Bacillus suaedaesalsae TaxID=2810349 RepID=A0ABS2DI96_9BACI|nr:hypothetical protein [Bacillus suaedaesalsae]MBM6618205.1 hypothetical protein [Bacillus suaedaesalsae]
MEEKKQNNRVAAFHKKEENENVILNKSNIGQSGNSDVDVNVNIEIETISIAYAMLCSMWARNQMTDVEFERALDKFDELRDRKSDKSNEGQSSKSSNVSRNNKKDSVMNNKRLFRL